MNKVLLWVVKALWIFHFYSLIIIFVVGLLAYKI